MTNEEILIGNKLIAEFMGYVKTPIGFNIQLHSRMSGFGSGYKTGYVLKSQFDELISAYEKDDRLSIDKFYKQKDMEYSYIFDGNPNHLFLCAYKNRTSCLKHLLNPKYNESWDALMPVVEKIESINGRIDIHQYGCSLQYKFGSVAQEFSEETKKESVFEACVKFIKWYNSKIKQS